VGWGVLSSWSCNTITKRHGGDGASCKHAPYLYLVFLSCWVKCGNAIQVLFGGEVRYHNIVAS
jgi:hypothetical protein